METDIIKIEQRPGVCMTCSRDKNTSNIFDLHLFGGQARMCNQVILECFKIDISSYRHNIREGFAMCENCIQRLEDAYSFKQEIESALMLLNKYAETPAAQNVISSSNIENSSTTSYNDDDGNITNNVSRLVKIKNNKNKAPSQRLDTVAKDLHPAQQFNKRKKVVLTIEQKLTLIERFESGESTIKLASEYGVGNQTVRDIIKQKTKLEEFTNDCYSNAGPSKRKSMKMSSYEDLDSALREWLNKKRAEGTAVSGPACTKKAKLLHEMLGLKGNFSASSGWLTRFKHRYGIR